MTIPNFKIKCSDALMAELEKHCFSETKVEVGGFLVGHIDGAVAEVTHVIPAEHSVGKSTQLTFTHDTWDALHSKMEDIDGVLIGWYHSHPNFGVFLSDHDQFIQQNFFKKDGNVTIVIDPIRGRRGWFYSSNNKIVKYEKETATTRARLGASSTNSDENIEAVMGTSSSGGVSLGKVVGISMVTSLLGVFLGFGLNSMTGSSATQQGQINQLTQEIALLKNVFQTARIAQFNGSGAAVTFQAPEVKSSPKPTPSPTLTPKATASSTASSTASKKTTTPDTKTTPSPVEGAKCDTKKDTKKIKNLECVNGKWVGKDAFSEGKPSDSSTGTN